MVCQICFEDLGDAAFSLPCGHIYCLTCIRRLKQRNTRLGIVECPSCREVAPSRISADNIRKVFLSPASSQTQALQVRLQEIEKERDEALRDLGHLTSTRFDPFVRALDAKDALLAIKDEELRQLKAELFEAKTTISTVLPEKERQICQFMENHSRLANDYQVEVSEHRKARADLCMKDAEIERLKQLVTRIPSQSPTTIWPISTLQGMFTFSSPIKSESTSASESISTPGPPNPFSSPGLFSTSTITSSSAYVMKDFSSPDPDRTLVDPPDLKDLNVKDLNVKGLKSGRSSKRSSRSSPHLAFSEDTAVSASSRKQTAEISNVAPVRKSMVESRKAAVAKPRAEILWRGYGCPKRTPVPECTASDGYHDFTGKGTNGYATRYTCKICDFWCSERR